MSKSTRVTERYAKALILEGVETSQLESIAKDVEFVYATIQNSRDLQVLLESPVVRPEKKEELLLSLFTGKVGQVMINYFVLICRKGRESALRDICASFIQQYLDIKNIATVNITSSTELAEEDRKKIVAELGATLNKEISLQEEIDESLIGGLIIRHRDKQMDLSVKSQLRRIKENLAVK